MSLQKNADEDASSALTEQGEWFHQLADRANEVFWVAEFPGFHIVYTSPAYETVWGRKRATINTPGQTWFDSLHPEDRERMTDVARTVLPSGKAENTYRIVRPDGQIRWVRDRAYPVRDAAGNVYRIVGAAEDITERTRSEQLRSVLSKLGQELHTATTPVAAANIIVNHADEFFQWDAATLHSYDAKADLVNQLVMIDTIKGKKTEFTSSLQIPPSERARTVLNEGARLILRSDADAPVTDAQRFGDESRPSLSLMFAPIRDGAKTVGILSIQSYRLNAWNDEDLELLQILADYVGGALNRLAAHEQGRIAEQRIAEQAALLDIAPEAIMVKEVNDRIIYWNKGAERLYGWTNQEFVGRKSIDLHKDKNHFYEALDVVLNRGEWHAEMNTVAKDGREIIVQTRWTLVRDADQKPKSILVIDTDITEKKRLEAQILRSQRMESIGTLAGGIAHDLNNVLAPILMSLELLRARIKSPEELAILDMLQSSSQRGADLIRQVLAFGRGLESRRSALNVRDIAGDVEKVIRDTFPKNIKCNVQLHPDLWTIEADATQIHQVLLNLCVNARDAMPNGGALTISLSNISVDEAYARMNPGSQPGPYLAMTVEDTGVGIPPEIQPKIFDPFFTTKEPGKGTGLGLPTVQSIVKNHKGFLNVYSEPGKGAKFKIFLPASATSAHVQNIAEPNNALPRGCGELILIVDDEENICSITARALESFGYRTLCAPNGAQAVAVYAKHRHEIAAVFTDMTMPVMDGPAEIMALRAINPNVVIIAASGLGINNDSAKAGGLNVRHFVAKPYTAEQVLRTLNEVLHPARAVAKPPALR